MTVEKLLQEENRFAALCDNLITDHHQYADRKQVTVHNKAQTKLNRIADQQIADPETAERFFSDLMAHESAKVRLHAAGYALAKGVCEAAALQILRGFASGEDRGAAFDASMSLYVWEHKMNHKT